jgi:thymidine kinase
VEQAGSTAVPREIAYEVLCRMHHRRRMTAARAHAVALGAEPLPFG